MTNRMRVWDRRVWGSFALCVPLALLSVCSTTDKPKPVAVQELIQSPGKSSVTIADTDDGAAVTLETTQTLVVNLFNPASAVNGNLDWSIVDLQPGVLTVLGSRFERSPRDNNPADAAGITIWRIKPQAPGRVSLKFALRRPHSLDPATQTVTYDVTVK